AWMIKRFNLAICTKTPQISIRLGAINDSDKTYFNGVLIGETGLWNSNLPQAYDKIRIYNVPEGLLRMGKENVILVKVEKYFPESIGIEQDKTEIGPTSLIDKQFYNAEYFKLVLLMIYFTAGFYFLFLFFRRRKEPEYLYFGTFTLLLVIYQFMRNQIKYESGLELYLLKKIEYSVLFVLNPFLFHFLRKFLKFRVSIFTKIMDGISIASLLFVLFSSDVRRYSSLNHYIVQPLWIFYLLFGMFYIFKSLSMKNRDALYFLAAMVLMVTCLIIDVFSERNIIVAPRLVGFAFIGFILILATVLANRFVTLNEENEELNINLEEKVTIRTSEMEATLKEVQALKIQQDGDYFRTAMLLNPLMANNNQSKNVGTEFFIKQKKSFLYKGDPYEIGGDICITSNLNFSDGKYTIFVNGDAMGKSMQGAGGALVMAVVFNSVIARSKINPFGESIPPDQWLEETFIELQNVFESFEGSMYISVIMGIIHEETGLLYYINAGHPWSVLYRNGKAQFLEDSYDIQKLGSTGVKKSLKIKRFQMLPGDTIFAGSDGRDDIQIGIDADGERLMNEDEWFFLAKVETEKGNLERIAENIQNSGELTDDFTLLKISYRLPDEK
ncbi:MAG: SpoIIE family protein phosphatase, partial [Leptospira sp.]|nr:SpoIIE family protein phosphatase [Leptospira sp.]